MQSKVLNCVCKIRLLANKNPKRWILEGDKIVFFLRIKTSFQRNVSPSNVNSFVRTAHNHFFCGDPHFACPQNGPGTVL